ncbi:hypothetical protein [Actinoplanes sp. NPDC051494]|uniref:hypothetical protein n=1 Tax=Actinoplanes sp. NPDC051494 TaxID=3363907 RepID=UPI0037B560A6
MSAERLFDECVAVITRAAYDSEGAHEQAMELMAESQDRHQAAGHARDCRSGVYTLALGKAQATQLFQKYKPERCSCGKGV